MANVGEGGALKPEEGADDGRGKEDGEDELPEVRVGDLQPGSGQQSEQGIADDKGEEDAGAKASQSCYPDAGHLLDLLHVEVQFVGCGLYAGLIHGLHAGGADGEAAGVDDFEEVEGFVAFGEVGGEEGGAVVVELAAGVPPVPCVGTADDVVALFVLYELGACGDGIFDEEIFLLRTGDGEMDGEDVSLFDGA